uniref:Putative tick transposon n=1 Tax=Rhipicephalus pulchellus TaxID=72859 RepID=L7M3W2_RHIPC
MLQLYSALFLGFLRYSLPALSNTCKTNIRALQSVQAQTLRISLGLPRCSSTAATIVIAQEQPVTTHVVVETLRAHIRHLTRLPSHHLACLPARRPRASFCRIVTNHRDILPSSFKPAMRPASALWCLHQPHVCLSVPGIVKKARLSPLALKQFSLCLINETYFDRVHVYTDGSTNSNSSTGAVVVPSGDISMQLKFSHITTSTAAELGALQAAVKYILRQPPNQWAIFCDSRSALQTLQFALRHGLHEQLVYEIRHDYHQALENGHDVTFQWLPSHCGIAGNDRADEAARSAHEKDLQVPIPLSRTDAARQLQSLARRLTLLQWNTQGFSNSRVYSIYPNLQLRLPSGLSRRDETLLCRMWLGVAFTNAYSHLIGMANSAACNSCGREETIEHILCHCPSYQTHRRVLGAKLDRLDARPLSEKKILGPWSTASDMHKATKALLSYLKATGLHERL